MELYNSLLTFDDYCKYGMDFVDDKVRYHPCWLPQETGHNCYEGDDEFRSKLMVLNQLLERSLQQKLLQRSKLTYIFLS